MQVTVINFYTGFFYGGATDSLNTVDFPGQLDKSPSSYKL